MKRFVPVLLGFAVAAAAFARPEGSPSHRRLAAAPRLPVSQSAAIPPVPCPSPAVAVSALVAEDRPDRFPVRVEGVVLDAETGIWIDGARVWVHGGTGYCQHGESTTLPGGGFEMTLTGGPGVRVLLGVSAEEYEPEFLEVQLEGHVTVVPPIRLRPEHRRTVTVQGRVKDMVTRLPISGVMVAIGVQGAQEKVPWISAEMTDWAGGFRASGRLLPGTRGKVWLSAPGYRPLCLGEVGLEGSVVDLPTVSLEQDATRPGA